MKKFLFSSVSAAALLAASVAVAQDKGAGGAAPGGGAGGNAPAARDFGGSAGGGAPGAERGDRGATEMPSAEKSKPSAEGPPRDSADAKGEKLTGQNRTDNRAARDGAEKDLKAGAKADQAKKEPDRGKADENASSGASSGEEGKATPGNAAGEADQPEPRAAGEAKQGGPHVTLNADQRTRVNSAFKGHKGSASVNVNVDVRVGTRLPRSVTLVTIPSDVLVVVPDWGRYRYVIVGDTVCIIDPVTYEIIDVIVLA